MATSRQSILSEAERLALICDAVDYAQRTRAAGAPVATGAKAVREAVFYLWESYRRGKHKSARYRSARSVGYPAKELVYDHSIPFTLLYNALLQLPSVDPGSVRPLLERMCVAALLTKDEDARLTAAGLRERMPAAWDGLDPLARYRSTGIEVVPNERLPTAPAFSPRCGAASAPQRPASRPAAPSNISINAPSDHPKFQTSAARTKTACLAICAMLVEEGFHLLPSARRDGFKMLRSRDGLSFSIDPKINAVRVGIGKHPPAPPPSELVHAGGQPNWLTVDGDTTKIAVEYLRRLSRA